MSRMAQEFEQLLKGGRTNAPKEAEVAKSTKKAAAPKTGARKKTGGAKSAAQARPRTTKAAGKPAAGAKRWGTAKIPLPAAKELRLVENGITAHGNQMVQFEFSNGSIVRMRPENLDKARTGQARDVMAAWLAQQIKGTAKRAAVEAQPAAPAAGKATRKAAAGPAKRRTSPRRANGQAGEAPGQAAAEGPQAETALTQGDPAEPDLLEGTGADDSISDLPSFGGDLEPR